MSRLKYYREKKGYTQSNLATLSGVNHRMIQSYEQGTRDIKKAKAENVYKISLVLGCTMEDLMKEG